MDTVQDLMGSIKLSFLYYPYPLLEDFHIYIWNKNSNHIRYSFDETYCLGSNKDKKFLFINEY